MTIYGNCDFSAHHKLGENKIKREVERNENEISGRGKIWNGMKMKFYKKKNLEWNEYEMAGKWKIWNGMKMKLLEREFFCWLDLEQNENGMTGKKLERNEKETD